MSGFRAIVAFDLDDTITTREGLGPVRTLHDYQDSGPNLKIIKIVNELYVDGYYIKIFTARGMGLCHGDIHMAYREVYQMTLDWLDKHNVRFHELILGKTNYDLLVDDKAMNVRELCSSAQIKNRVDRYA